MRYQAEFVNMSFRPKVVDWECSLWPNKKWFRSINSCIKCTPIQIFAMGQVRQRNGVKPPETRVLDIKYVMRNQTDVLEHQNGVQIPKMWVLDLKECIEIFQVEWLESYCSETFNQRMPILVSATGRVCRRNGTKPSKTWVLDLK